MTFSRWTGNQRRAGWSIVSLWLGLAAAQCMAQGDFQGATHMMPFDEDFIGYSKAQATGAVARLQAQLDKGEARLAHHKRFGYLPAVLEALKVPQSSQMLVFSKTSFQRERISPRSPRALFFSDDVYIGFIPDSPLLELSVADPQLGAVFYTLSQETNTKPRFVRTDQCLECHASAKSMGVPGHLLRSFATDEDGVVEPSSGTSLVNHRTPLAERWGGWYVTGSSGGQAHRGNLFGKAAFARHEQQPRTSDTNNLERFFDVARYPGSQSDIVALMVLEHQAHLHNFITRVHYEATIALQTYGHLKYLKNISESFIKYLLFAEEAPLTAPIRGASGFSTEFAAQGPRDKQGRSLRDFDLQTRLFKYPCSYLIYSEAFDALPEKMKAHVYGRLWDILTGKETNPVFERLTEEDRRAILEILADTKPGLPEYWKANPREQLAPQAQ